MNIRSLEVRLRESFFLICILIFYCVATSTAQAKEPVMVFAAASLNQALKEIAAEFKNQGGGAVDFNFGGSKSLRLQIVKGLPCDIFFAADTESVNQLIQQHLTVDGSSVSLLENKLIVVGAADSEEKINSLFDLNFLKGEFLAMADPKTAPAGVYAMQALSKAGLLPQLEKFIVPSLDVRAALAFVESGNAKYAFVYATDALVSKKVKRLYDVPPSLYDPIVYSVVLIKREKRQNGARDFFNFLQTQQSKIIFQKYGFHAR